MSKKTELRKDGTPYKIFRSQLLLDSGFDHGFLGRDLDLLDDVARSQAEHRLFPDSRVYHLSQVHGRDIVSITHSSKPADSCVKKADGLICTPARQQSGSQVLCIRTADCAPVLLAVPASGTVAALHCGWRSAAANILPEALDELERRGAKRCEILLCIGPSAGVCCYEVGTDFSDLMGLGEGLKKKFAPAFTQKDATPYFDLQRFLLLQAEFSGVPIQNVSLLQFCTMCGDDFFSYRKEKALAGRQLSYICAQPPR